MAALTPLSRPGKNSFQGRRVSGLDQLVFDEEFQGSAVNTAQFNTNVTTMTVAVANGVITLNNGGDTANATVARVQSYAHISMCGAFPTYFDCVFKLDAVMQTNNKVEIGLGFASGTSAPTDGLMLRLTDGGTMEFVTVNNSVETKQTLQVPDGFTLAAGEFYRLQIASTHDQAECRLNNALVGYIPRPRTTNLLTRSSAWPVLFRIFNTGTVGTAQKLHVSNVAITQGDVNQSKPWPHTMARAGFNAFQGQTAGTMGLTANYANSAAPSSASLSNTAAGYTTLGGQWQFAAVAGAETDYALFGFQVPAASATAPGMTLHITGVRISTVNTGAAVATTATVLQWAIATGATAVSLATAEAAAAKAPRRVTLGFQSFPIGAAIAAIVPDIDRTFQTPLVANPGEFVHVILKMPIGSATASQVVRGTCIIEGYFD